MYDSFFIAIFKWPEFLKIFRWNSVEIRPSKIFENLFCILLRMHFLIQNLGIARWVKI